VVTACEPGCVADSGLYFHKTTSAAAKGSRMLARQASENPNMGFSISRSSSLRRFFVVHGSILCSVFW
jgi:hypothetical protein